MFFLIRAVFWLSIVALFLPPVDPDAAPTASRTEAATEQAGQSPLTAWLQNKTSQEQITVGATGPAGGPMDGHAGAGDKSSGPPIVTADDIARFCTRHPETCATGMESLQDLGIEAEDGMRVIVGHLMRLAGEAMTGDARNRETAPAPPSDTLTEADRLPVGGN